MFFEFSAEALSNVLEADSVSIVSEIWGLSFSCRPPYGNVVFELDHELVDEIGTCLFWLLCSERCQELFSCRYIDPFLKCVQKICPQAVNDRKYVFHFRPNPNIWPEKYLALGQIPKPKPNVQIFVK